MEILQEIHYHVSQKNPLREGSYNVNTVSGSFLTDRVLHIIEHTRKPLIPKYTIHKPFVQEKREYVHEGDIKIIILPSILDQEISTVSPVDYSMAVSDLKNRLQTNGLNVPDDFIPYNTSLSYMRTFIYNIAKIFPTIMMNKPIYDYAIPISLKKLIGESRTHSQSLTEMMKKHYFKELCTFSTENLDLEHFLNDQEIADILQLLKLPVNESRIYEYEFYIYSIFLKYFEYGRSSMRILNFYLKLFKTDKSKIFLTYEEIKSLTLKDKVTESNKIRLSRHKLSSDDKYIFDFRQTHNIDEMARLGRLRDYNATHRDAEYALFGDEVREDNDRGGDGNRNDGDDE